jgi:recombination protein RecT
MTAMTETRTQVSKAPIILLRERLEARVKELEAALPDDIEPRQFIRAAMTSASLNPEILATSWQSFWNACLRACRDGLLPDGVEGAIVPYKDKANWIPMYQGLLRRFRRSGQFKWITADVVRWGEQFVHFIDEGGEHFKHVPAANDDAAIVKTYACALTKDGGFFVAVLSPRDIDKIKRMSRAQRDDAPWNMWPEEMMKKSALRRLIKLLPTTRDLIPTEEDDDEPPHIQMPTIDHAPSRPSNAAAALDQFANKAPPDNVEVTSSTSPQEGPPSAAVEEEEGGGQAMQPGADEQSAAALSSSTEGTPTAADHPTEDPIALAYRHGVEAKAAGHRRTALPGDYRGAAETKRANAWFAGFDGKPMPRDDKELI